MNCFVTYASSVTVHYITRVTKSYDSPIHYSQVAEAEDDKETADSVGTKVENVKMVKKAAFAFKKKKNLKSSKKKKKHRLGSVVEQIMRKRRAEEAGGRPSTKQGSGSDKVSRRVYWCTVNLCCSKGLAVSGLPLRPAQVTGM